MLCHYADKSCDHKYCDGGDILICHVTSREHMFKGFCEFMGTMFGRHWSIYNWRYELFNMSRDLSKPRD